MVANDDDEWNVAEDDGSLELVGFTGNSGTGYVFDTDAGVVYEAEADHESGEVVPDESSARRLDKEETLADAIEDIGERMGWERLTEFAEEHLEEE
jgi:hypothetical protein